MRDDLKLRLVNAFNSAKTPSDRLAACRLVDNSQESMVFVAQLEADKSRITTLPSIKAPRSIARNVFHAIQPSFVVNRLQSQQIIYWRSYALAASMMIAVSIGTYFITTSLSGNENSIVRKPSIPVMSITKTDNIHESTIASVIINREVLPMPGRLTVVSESMALQQPANIVRDDEKNWLGASVNTEMPQLDSVTPRLPFLISMTEWSSEEVKTKLRQEFAASNAYRFDLFTRDVPRTVEQIMSGMKNQGYTLTTASLTSEHLKRKTSAIYLIYCEALTKDEWMNLFSKWRLEETISFAHFMSAGTGESRELKSLLGFDPGFTKRTNDELTRTVGEQTIDQVARALQKSKEAILTTAGPNGYRVNPSNSQEVRMFSERRGERLIKAVPMIILIRPVS